MGKNFLPVVYLTMKPFLNSSSEPSTRLSFNKKCVFTHVYIYFLQECTYCSKSHPHPSVYRVYLHLQSVPVQTWEGEKSNVFFRVGCLFDHYNYLEAILVTHSIKICCITFSRNMCHVNKTISMLLLLKSLFQMFGSRGKK